MTFEAPGGPYTMEVEKGRNISQIGGDGWARFLAHMRLTGGELISFSFRAERPKLAVIYLNLVKDDEDDEDDEDNEDPLDEDDEDPLHEAIIAQRTRLSDDTSILHHAFISIFIALWAVITHYISIVIAILSYFTRFTMKRGNAGSWNSGWKRSMETYSAQLQKP